MYGKRLKIECYAKRMNTQDRSGSDSNQEKNNGHKRQKREQLIEQNQQRLSSSDSFPFSDFLFYIHWLGRNLDNIDILIL